MSRHQNALDDFDTVLRLTNGNFDKAMLMKSKILAREAKWSEAKKLTKQYAKKTGNSDKEVQDLVSMFFADCSRCLQLILSFSCFLSLKGMWLPGKLRPLQMREIMRNASTRRQVHYRLLRMPSRSAN
jgi:hypothetical protein